MTIAYVFEKKCIYTKMERIQKEMIKERNK